MLVNALSFVNMIQPVAAARPAAAATAQDGAAKPFSRLLDTQASERRDAERKAAAAAADGRAAAAKAADRSSTPAPDVVYRAPSPRPAAADAGTQTAAPGGASQAADAADSAAQGKVADGKPASGKPRADNARADAARTARAGAPANRGGDPATDAAAAAAPAGRPALGPDDRLATDRNGGCLPPPETEADADPETQPICDAVPLALMAGQPTAPATAPAGVASGTGGVPTDPPGLAPTGSPGLPPVDAPTGGNDRSTRRSAAPNAGDRALTARENRAPVATDNGVAATGLQPRAGGAGDALGADNNAAAADAAKAFAAELQALLPAATGAAPLGGTAAHAATAAPAGAGAVAGVPVEGRLGASPGTPEFAGALGAQLSTFVAQGVHHARLELNPADMGPVTVQIQLDGQNAQVRLAAENADTRQALEQAMPELAGSLREAGLTLSGGGVYEQPQPQPQQQSTGSGPRDLRSGGSASANATAVGAAGSNARPDTSLPDRRRGVVDLIA